LSSEGEPLIVVTARLLPSDALRFERSRVGAVIAIEGGRYSHGTILAEELGLPLVGNIPAAFGHRLIEAAPALVDGDSGRIVVFPRGAELVSAAPRGRRSRTSFRQRALETARLKLSYGGDGVRCYGNVMVPADVALCVEAGADGIGLYRLEDLYLASDHPLSEDELLARLGASLTTLPQLPVTIRLLDAAPDKSVPGLHRPLQETNPLLGIRGIRALLAAPEMLGGQLRVCLRLARSHDVRILVPMVTDASEMAEVRTILLRQATRAGSVRLSRAIPLGAMVETPAALLGIRALLQHTDFVSLGTNDLVQYLMAADRDNPGVSQYYEKGTKLLVDMLPDAVDVCRKQGKSCVLCGEIARDTELLEPLLATGLREFSMIPLAIPAFKQRVAELADRSGPSDKGEQV
jgi:phosphotransferase system enzyme I (PtsI)